MKDYHKIHGLCKRYTDGEKRGQFIVGDFSKPEFEYLYNNKWVMTEKIDGSNIKIHWDGSEIEYGGRTKKTDFPPHIQEVLDRLKSTLDFFSVFTPNENGFIDVTLYGEIYGNKIQKRGKQYIPDGVDFILFDVLITNEDGRDMFLKREDVDDVASKLGIKSVPIIFTGTIEEGIEFVKDGFSSTIGEAEAEGLVAVPVGDLRDRSGARIITKLKTVDFRNR